MAYLTYDEYKRYGGDLPEASFPVAELKARKMIDRWTDSRVQRMAVVPEAVKVCMMQVIKYQSAYGVDQTTEQPIVASFNTDGYSESYGSAAEQADAAYRSLKHTVMELLYGETDDYGVSLLYRGIQT